MPVYRLLIVFSLSIIFAISSIAKAQENKGDAQSYHSFRISAYSKTFGDLEEDGYTSTFRTYVTSAVLKYRTFDEFLDPETLHLQSLGIRPTLQVVLPTKWDKLLFIPSIDLAYSYSYELKRYLFAGSTSAGFRYVDKSEKSRLVNTLFFTYGSRDEVDTFNLSDYFRVKLKTELRKHLNLNIGKHTVTVAPFASFSYFLDDLELGLEDEALFKEEKQLELGFELSTDPRIRIFNIKLPEIDVKFVFGDEFKGVKIRI